MCTFKGLKTKEFSRVKPVLIFEMKMIYFDDCLLQRPNTKVVNIFQEELNPISALCLKKKNQPYLYLYTYF